MIARAALLAWCGLLPALATAAEDPVTGLWIHHEKWEIGFEEKGEVHKSANAAVVNFCPGGVFRVATGVIYQSTRSPVVVIGASDGLALYSGRWWKSGETISVEYRLFDAEIRMVPDDVKSPETHIGKLTFAKGRLQFPFSTRFGKTWQMNLLPAARYEKKVDPDFVECPTKPD